MNLDPALSATLCGLAGRPWPMGPSLQSFQDQEGVNFAVYSRHAERIEVCLFDLSGAQELARITLPVCTDNVWHGFVPGLQAGQLYGLRAYGPYQPAQGQRFNPAKLLLDPFARALVGDTTRLAFEFDYLGQLAPDVSGLNAQLDPTDNATRMPKAQVLDLDAELQAGRGITPGPLTPLDRTVLYEAHVKGLTQRHPAVPAEQRGCFAGLCSPPMLAHYQRLGITTLCLLPVQLHISEAHLLKRGLHNYWGYNTLGYFMPEPGYASGQFSDARAEFRHMVDQLHRHGLELVLDVVYNHTAESDTFGPTLSWRGLDNASWYALDATNQYLNFSGCGNSLNLGRPCAVQLVMDSLRWWVQAFGVDGFRFDLATALGRDPAQQRFTAFSGLLTAIAQDPVLAQVKLIAEPWDLGPQGYQLGQFPTPWLEWNDRYRDTLRAWWLGYETTRGEMARRLTGSSDLFQHDGRSPLASLNLITSHDGMTLTDLTSYRDRHNLPNGEDNRDGHAHNLSANAGVEGATQDAAVLVVRGQWQRALLAALLCAQGAPQLLAGDELGHTQQGNNNAYCQDNETTWLNWAEADEALMTFVAGLVHLRQAHAAFRSPRWFTGQPVHTDARQAQSVVATDITWRNPDGSALMPADWNDASSRSLICQMEVPDAGAGALATERWILVFHAASDSLSVVLPPGLWRRVLDSAAALVWPAADWGLAAACVGTVLVAPRSVLGLVQTIEEHHA